MTTERRIKALEQQVAELQQLLESQGISIWQSPAKAAPVLGVSRDFLIQQIKKSRLNPRHSDLKNGIHYRSAASPGAIRPTWQINVIRFQEILAIPAEKRRA